MAKRVRIGTFNVENLFARFTFREEYTQAELKNVVQDGWLADQTKFVLRDDKEKRLTAKAIREINADILALQEVENLDVLKRFNTQHLRELNYRYLLVIDGNDPRLIDVGILSRYPFASIRTHQFQRTSSGRAYIFSRDCLEVDIQIASDTRLPIFVNHFKSMIGGRDETMNKRKAQAAMVIRILMERFGPNPANEKFVVLGDLNDYMPSPGLEPLVGKDWLENIVQTRLNPDERWTHYYAGGNEYRQLDYILLSQALALAPGNKDARPEIERRGLPKRATKAGVKHFPGVGDNKPKASDHCPVVIEINV
jgi:endonuclease/exonuclease/phosphatase family metal-dependent hydrolase